MFLIGRCARAGRSGTAYSIVAPDEYAYLLDLHLFLGRSFEIVPVSDSENIPEGAIGKIPQSMIEEELSELIMYHENNTDIVKKCFLIILTIYGVKCQ
jgi:ATP-dependent RNA helicase DDX54/DBP10